MNKKRAKDHTDTHTHTHPPTNRKSWCGIFWAAVCLLLLDREEKKWGRVIGV